MMNNCPFKSSIGENPHIVVPPGTYKACILAQIYDLQPIARQWDTKH